MDARDYVRMRYEKRLRDGAEPAIGRQKIGTFEKFTKVIHVRFLLASRAWQCESALRR